MSPMFRRATLRLGLAATLAAFSLLGLGQALAQAPGDLVHFRQLMQIVDVPPPPGFSVAEKPSGSTTKAPVVMSEARVSFKSGEDKSAEITIMDGLGAAVPFMAITQAVEMESSEEYIKPLVIKGVKGNETYRFQDKEGELTLVVANRFLVSIRGLNMPDNATLKALAASLDFDKLTQMAK